MHQYTAYWDRGARNVPDMTGARNLLDAWDMPMLADKLSLVLPLQYVLDVGCGTGRVSKYCDTYHGVDIAPSAVEYCQARNISSSVISGPEDMPMGPFQWILCMSVFTHIGIDERRAYLEQFALRAPKLLVDIIPGDGSGDVAMWTADPDLFREDLTSIGYKVVGEVPVCTWAGGHTHHFFYAER